ncbi:class II aldolase/adducin family protein [Pigmentiphaga sp. GD03639]|uniref:class II aldolase/adducin family protein n=1 Tax=Pigmentiphaga sp. GD03639 TaxID=2975354 RepID=UPI0024471712|nr:class II aldolase/adducin family protein [Pigmentiphaga sp. GD03639]MDH2234703.1 class II aldolase/adducin family protein [Pigmentiphaga sp. GD03639]
MQTNEETPKYPMTIPPAMEDAREETERRRRELAIGCRLLSSLNLDWGTAGHITVRDARQPDCFWVNAYGRHFGTLTTNDLLLVDKSGKVLAGDGILNPASFAVHAAIHEARPDVLAIAHGHSTHGKAWASLGRQLDPITQDACAFFDDHAVLELYSGIVLSDEEGKLIARTLGSRKALLLQNHGLLTVGTTIESCIFWLVSLDNACRVQLLAEAAGQPRALPEEVARRTRRAIGREVVAYFGYQNLRQKFIADHPSLEHCL